MGMASKRFACHKFNMHKFITSALGNLLYICYTYAGLVTQIQGKVTNVCVEDIILIKSKLLVMLMSIMYVSMCSTIYTLGS